MPKRENELNSLRKKIDRIDDQILKLLRDRVEVARKIAEVKRISRLPIWHPRREESLLTRVEKTAMKMGLNGSAVRTVFWDIIGISKQAQKPIKVAYLGPEGTISEEAAYEFFSATGASFMPCMSIGDVFRRVEDGEAVYGVIPVESSIEGSVTASLDQFITSSLMICGEIEQRVRQNLIINPSAKLEDVKILLSHPQAIAQCRRFIEAHLPNATVRETESTASAVRALKRTKNAAAIGSEVAAKKYGMKIEARDIQDVPTTFTRFCILGREDCTRTGKDKTTVIFSVANVPGALYKALECFALRNINITKVESRPTKKAAWEYMFFLDFEGHREDKICKEALKELERKSAFLKILGSYPSSVRS